jgi:hypothetical protein
LNADLETCCELADWMDWQHHVGAELADTIGRDPARAAAALAHYVPKKK